ncbi:uncharacterized protein [Solanum tuberosum]|uniref:Calcium/calmodulin protein kinase n=1 Tax=Solanum tuberosum TaxID=4113 RepID=M1C5T0_SOLTU|nr:PREDICTED: uncharacterized protein LOC107060305 [Solanum tuberosum]
MSLQPHDQTTIEDQEYGINNSQEKFSYHDPPESFWLSKDSERDWFDQNAAMQRKSSMKFAFSGKANNKNSKILSHNNQNPSLFSIPKTRKSISGEGNPGRVNNKAVKSKSKSRFTRSRSEPAGRKTLKQVLVSEPGSPKVSCTGRVRRSKSKKESRTIRTGFWKKVRAALKIRSGEKGGASVQTAESDRFGSGSGSGGLKRSTTRRWSE